MTEVTRDRVLDALASLLATDNVAVVGVADVAEASGVSIATIYRHFGNKEGLFRALATRNVDAFDDMALDLADHATMIRTLFDRFAEQEDLLRVQRSSGLASGLTARRVPVEVAAAERVIGDRARSGSDRDRAVRLLVALASSPTYLQLRDKFDLAPAEAAADVTWAFTALLTAVESNPDQEES